jgi:hypothetical protein
MEAVSGNFFEYIQKPLSLPYHINYYQANRSVEWNGYDSEERFNTHLADPKSAALLKNLGWDLKNIIAYNYNSCGFRCDEFDDRSAGMALGCSFTEGVSLPLNMCWPSILAEMVGTHIWNLGVGGSSIDTVFRLFEFYVIKLKPKFVCILLPPETRLEYMSSSGCYEIMMPQKLGQHPSFAKDWLQSDSNGFENQKKTILAIERICSLLNIPLVVNDIRSNYELMKMVIRESHYGRDLGHYGPKFHQYQAQTMFDKLSRNIDPITDSIFKKS